MTVKCVHCTKTFTHDPRTVEIQESQQKDKVKSKRIAAKCPHCGKLNTVNYP